MNKTLALGVLAAASSSCFAQASPPNSITLYGIVDAGIQHVTGYKGGSNTSLVSGIMDGSRFGLRGNEDLGGGYRAIFTLENRTELNDGSGSNRPKSGTQLPDRMSFASLMFPTLPAPVQAALQPAVTAVGTNLATQAYGVNLANNFWDRQAYVGLVTPFGAVLGGRQYTPAYEVSATFDTMQTQSSLGAGQVASFPSAVEIRISNALQYRIQLGGLSASLMYGFGGVTGDNSASRFMGGMAMYRTERFAVGASYNERNNELGQEALRSTVFGASAVIGPGTLSGMYQSFEDDNPSGVSGIAAGLIAQGAPAASAALVQNGFIEALRIDGKLAHVGYKMTLERNTFYIAYSQYDDGRPANADVASYGVAYTYALSKRTDLNAVLTHFDNKNLAQAAPGQAGFLGGVTSTAGKDADSIAFGIRHRF
jgi:GBP family porin